ncbi:hypothetical protein KCG48_10635 [Proteiniclasticum sp. BAD-10]|uniref:Uncharacterized protein n=1 Tax=Proteiniclasticum sediminis TaxID=2804028 RepID=A0A941CRG8_9CLOT|nr:hypothetical protein [Proteiniclasticum sediminis]MBR0576789.1 hypothetical protein [Proteiniclasticum sediminis]
MTTKDLRKYSLVHSREYKPPILLATADNYEELEHHQKIHGLVGLSNIIPSKSLKPDLSPDEILRAIMAASRENDAWLIENGYATLNEIRSKYGIDPIYGGDVLLEKSSNCLVPRQNSKVATQSGLQLMERMLAKEEVNE